MKLRPLDPMHGVGLMRWGFGLFCLAFLRDGLVDLVERWLGMAWRGEAAPRGTLASASFPAPTPISREYALFRACGFEQGHAWMHEVCSAGLPGDSPYRADLPLHLGLR